METSIKIRAHLSLPHRRTIAQDVSNRCRHVSGMFQKSISGAFFDVTFTFNLWTYLVDIGFLSVTGHNFDSEHFLKAPLLRVVHLREKRECQCCERILTMATCICFDAYYKRLAVAILSAWSNRSIHELRSAISAPGPFPLLLQSASLKRSKFTRTTWRVAFT